MNFYKRNTQGTSYTYESLTGAKETLVAGKDGVTKEHIEILISQYNKEVRNNLKHTRAHMDKKLTEQVRQWEEDHPGKKSECRINLSLDAYTEGYDEMACSELMGSICHEHTEDPRIERLWEVIGELTDLQRNILILYHFEGYSLKEIGAYINRSESTVCRALKRAEDYIKKNFFTM